MPYLALIKYTPPPMDKEYNFWVYILTNWKKTVVYVGITNDLKRRLVEH